MQDGNDIENTGSPHQVLEILYHPMFIESKYSADKTIGHDIAAVKIQSTNLMPICLPTLGRGKLFFKDLLKTLHFAVFFFASVQRAKMTHGRITENLAIGYVKLFS